MKTTNTIKKNNAIRPKITLKSIKHHAGLSEETHAYTATIYVDGSRFASVRNAGHGGSDEVHPLTGGYPAIDELENRIKATYPKKVSKYFPEGLEESLESICCNLVNEFLRNREFKKLMRRICYIKAGEEGIYSLPAKYKPTPEMLAEVASWEWAKEGVTFLNTLPEDEALAIVLKN